MTSTLPKVSAVMPACYGEMAMLAVQCFRSQTYGGDTELIVMDNNADGSTIENLLPEDPRIKYFRVDKLPVGTLRNMGNAHATGDIIVNWDCDDWSHPERIGEQVGWLIGTGKAVTGFHSIYYFEIGNGSTYKYHFEPNRPHIPYACGSSQMYLRTWWEKHQFPSTGIEDYAFQAEAQAANQLDSRDGSQLLVARAHNGSVCYPTQLGKHRQFPVVPKSDLPPAFYAAIAPKAKPPKKSTATPVAKPATQTTSPTGQEDN